MEVQINSQGHSNVLATHKNTIEITKEDFLTQKGDCILGISSDKALSDLPDQFKELLKLGKKIRITLECNGFKDVITGRGNPLLTFLDQKSLVIRKSDYTDDRTLCIQADKAAADLDRKLIEELKQGGRLTATLEI